VSQPSPEPKRRGLGRGLEVLVGGTGTSLELIDVPVRAISPNPRQPRRRFEPEAGAGLAESIKAQGLLQPVVVRPKTSGGYELIAGERRLRAAKEAGIETLPALVRSAGDGESLLLSLVENVAREQLSAVEEARAYAMLMDEFSLSLGEISEKVGRSKPSVSNRLRLLDLPEEVLWMLARGELTEGHAKAILSATDDDQRKALARRVVRGGLSVRATERAARRMGAARKPRRSQARINPVLAERAAKAVEQLTGFRAKVTRSRIEIAFGDETGLEELVESLEGASLRSASSGD